ncbi:GNAT family N-acetyltransferase [Kribbella antibiotica]|uniref:GNAT family N-acetyltransferase n=1 Tax=Kribbella antibiotica TaxID=190195 RepID=A0A4R4YRR0_9ACTN|nr:GNAT family N-acetyltransferase [Kribbella antibiotica]TDD47965.1 GNAT family N-acetyltransferase [Kribbella antibiotica]
MSDDFRAVSLDTPAQYADAAALYREVFGYQEPDHGLNPRLLAALAKNGGSTIGILDATDRLVAFAYGFPGTSKSALYHYSQSAVVAADLQGRGLGRMLKYAQRDVALASGMTHMRWTYDPFQVRNAHFNLNVLGAQARWYAPDLYGPGTDRLVVDWNLTQESSAGRAPVAEIPVPADRASVTDRVIARVRDEFAELLAMGLVATGIHRDDDKTSSYLFGSPA